MPDDDIARNLATLQERIARAARAAGRRPEEITLVAVSKTHPPEAIRAAWAAGQRDFGENYAQELARKREALSDLQGVRWHFVGALQSNKARYVVPGAALLHAVDRPSVAEALDRRARAAGAVVEVLLEVNVGDEQSKAGVPPGEVEALLEALSPFEAVRVRGLMCIPPPGDPARSRDGFRVLRALRDRLAPQHPGLELLSMGMSDDFEVAIAEGATHVRVGTAIFGERPRRG